MGKQSIPNLAARESDAEVAAKDAEIARLKSELLTRDVDWLPAKDAEVAKLETRVAELDDLLREIRVNLCPQCAEWAYSIGEDEDEQERTR